MIYTIAKQSVSTCHPEFTEALVEECGAFLREYRIINGTTDAVFMYVSL